MFDNALDHVFGHGLAHAINKHTAPDWEMVKIRQAIVQCSDCDRVTGGTFPLDRFGVLDQAGNRAAIRMQASLSNSIFVDLED